MGAESGRRRECGVCGSRGFTCFAPIMALSSPVRTGVLFILPKPQPPTPTPHTARNCPGARAYRGNASPSQGCDKLEGGRGPAPLVRRWTLLKKPADAGLSGRVSLGAPSPRGHISPLGRGGPQLDKGGHWHRDCQAEGSKGLTSISSFPTLNGEGRAGGRAVLAAMRLPCGRGPSSAPDLLRHHVQEGALRLPNKIHILPGARLI